MFDAESDVPSSEAATYRDGQLWLGVEAEPERTDADVSESAGGDATGEPAVHGALLGAERGQQQQQPPRAAAGRRAVTGNQPYQSINKTKLKLHRLKYFLIFWYKSVVR